MVESCLTRPRIERVMTLARTLDTLDSITAELIGLLAAAGWRLKCPKDCHDRERE
ncbi:MAG: hypothetical protein KIT18_02455 [Burkholderiales bacterium]|nr:hypothetical protein [Burkholderiales bacterium]